MTRTGGVFEVRVDGASVWSRQQEGAFLEIKQLKQLVRDRVAPGEGTGPFGSAIARIGQPRAESRQPVQPPNPQPPGLSRPFSLALAPRIPHAIPIAVA